MALDWFKRLEPHSGLFAAEKIALIYNLLTSVLILFLFRVMDHPWHMLLDRAMIAALTMLLIYLYRPGSLKSDFENGTARELLVKYGYAPEKPSACISRLIHRLRTREDFPHEIGLFLSYPPEDVLGFIHSGGCGHKCSGCWKVYGDKQKAEQTFKKYAFCTKSYVRQWQQGKSIEQLTVAV